MTKGKMLLAAVAALGVAVPLFAQAEVPLIPLEKIFGSPPSRTSVSLSRDGKWLSWIAPRDGVKNVWIAPASNPNAARPLTNAREQPINAYSWSPDSKQVLFILDKGGAALYGVDIASAQQRTITRFDRDAEVFGISDEVKDRILVDVNRDIYSVDLTTGKQTPVIKYPGGYTRFIADRNLVIRAAWKPLPDSTIDLFRVVGNRMEAKPFEHINIEDSQHIYPNDFTSDGKILYWFDSTGRNTAALIAQDLATGKKTILAENSKAQVGRAMTNPKTGRIDAYSVNYLRNEWVPLEPSLKGDFDFIKSRLKGDFSVTSRPQTDDKWLLSVDPAAAPPATYLYDRSAKTLTKLWVSRPELEGAPLAAMYPVEIKSRDGLTLVSYLTLPPGSDPDGDGRPDKPVPLVLFVHGGPWSTRDNYGFNLDHQWLANRGYAVLSTNFRASSGFGKAFNAASNLQWGAKMHDDLLDAVDWAVKRGVTRPDKVAIMGPSYGGYATLAGLAFTPDKFACGVDIVGPSNLNTLLATSSLSEAQKTRHYRQIGNPTTPEGRALLKERSPLFKADQIKKPLLIGQGAVDPTVPVSEADQIVAAMKAKNIPVTYVVFPDEGHGFAKPANKIAFNLVVENFLAGCLGGRAEPIGNRLRNSTAEVRHGAEYAPGVKEALGTK